MQKVNQQFESEIYSVVAPLGTSLFHRQVQPKSQSFLQMIRYTVFPYLNLGSFTFFWILFDTCVFIYSLSWKHPEHQQPSNQFLKVSQAALFNLGQNYPYYIVHRFHYYRMFTSLLLFCNLYHYSLVILGIMFMSSYIEQITGTTKTFLLAITSAIAGQLTNNWFNCKATIESCTPILGLVGYLFGIIFWNHGSFWQYYTNEKILMIFWLILTIGLYIHLAIHHTSISLISGFGAFLYGIIFHIAQNNQGISKIVQIIAIILICLILAFLSFEMSVSEPKLICR